MADTFISYPIALSTIEKENRQVISSSDPTLAGVLHQINALSHGFKQSNFVANCPPPPQNSVNPHRSSEIERQKKLGNDAFTKKNYMDALKFYSGALELAASRPPWEPSQLSCDELSILLCNRSAAFLGAELLGEAYADALTCVKLKPVWVKGYYRLAKVCLKLLRGREALDVVQTGLQYEPLNEDLLALRREVLGQISDEAL